MNSVLAEFQRITSGGTVEDDLMDTIHLITATMDGIKEETDAI